MSLKKTSRILPILFSLFLLAACGGGGGGSSSGSSDNGSGLSSGQGIAVDPYIVGAIFQEVAADGTILQRQSTPSDEFGDFSFPKPLTTGSTIELKISDKGIHGGIPYQGMLRREVNANSDEPQVVSPMTTILANGATADNLLQTLNDAGITGLTAADLYADPMAGLGTLTDGVTDRDLACLQASMAIDAYLEITGNFTADANTLRDTAQLAILHSMVKALLDTLNPGEFTRIKTALAGDPSITSPLTLGDQIRTALQQQQTLVALVKENMATSGSFNPSLVDQTVQSNLGQNIEMVKANYQTRVTAPTNIDGSALYSENCSGCHGSIASTSKSGRTAPQIQAAISANRGGMGSLSNLTAAEIEAIAGALSSSTPTNPPATTPDGLALYLDNCSGCHGSIASTTKPGRTAADIQAAIDANTGGMGSLSSLTTAEIEAIAGILPAAPATNPSTPPDGIALYNSECTGCHGTLNATTKAGRTAAQIEAAITANTGGMGSLSTLTAAEIQAIADALPAAPAAPPAPPVAPDGTALYTDNCSTCHGALASSSKAGRTAAQIQAAINANTGGMGFLSALTAAEIQAIADVLPAAAPVAPTPPAAPDGTALYTDNCSTCHGALASSSKAGRTAAQIQAAINANTGGMGFLSALTAAEIQAIADVLPAAAPGGPDYSDCTACHGQPPSGNSFPNTAGAHAVHVALPSINNDCAVCHAAAAHNSTVDVDIDPQFDSKSGAAVYNGDGTCSNIICHGGQTTPDWWSGSIVVNTQCSSCHAYGSSQYNSYASGRHSLHISRGYACTVCHNTSTLQNGHFADLATPAFEQSPASTIGGGGSTSVGSYSSGTCSSVACHGSHNW